MRLSKCLAALAGCATLSLGIASAAPVAMVTDLQGAATAARKVTLSLMAYIEPGTEIQVEAGAKLTLTFFARAQEQTFNGPAKIVVQADNIDVLQGGAGQSRKLDPDKVSAAKNFEPAARDRLSVATFVMRSTATPKLALVAPVDTKISTIVPEFSWKALNEAREYKLTLWDDQGRVLREARAKGTTWKPQPNEALGYGREYQWKVESVDAAMQAESRNARFSLLEEETVKRMARQKPKADAPFSERLLYAAQLETEGLAHEAAQQWHALAAERPQDAVLKKLAR